MLVLTDVGADAMLLALLNNTRAVAGNNLTLRLFTNNVVPTQLGPALIEAVGGGYTARTLNMGSWTINTANDPSTAEYPSETFTLTTLTGNPNIYGYYITDADGVVWWAELLPGAFIPPNNGDPLIIFPTLAMGAGTLA